jgi:NitT/TauT family transport system substrate-binding protein
MSFKFNLFKRKHLVAALLVCLPCAAAYSQEVVKLGTLKFASYGAVAYMKEIAPKHGFKIEEHVFAKGADIYPAVVAGEIDLAASASDGAIAARGNGVPISIVAGFSSGGARIVVRPDSGIKSMKELKGKAVATARGGAHELLLLAELERAGLTWSDRGDKDVRLLYLSYSDLNQALAGKSVDAICQSEPQAAIAIQKGIGVELLKPYDTPIGLPIRTLTMTDKMLREKPALAQRVLKAFVEATTTFQRKPEVAEKYIRERMFQGALSAEEYRGAMENAAFTTDISFEHIDATTELMTHFGMGKMAQPPKAKDWVRLDLLNTAKASAAANSLVSK